MMPYKKCTLRKRYKRLYSIWSGIKDRCLNKNNSSYKDYGGRGIKVCEEWENSFENFFIWSMENGYEETLTIDRINNDGAYCPENCRWVDMKIQSFNQRVTKHSTPYAGVSFRNDKNRYIARICINGKSKQLGSFKTLEEAIKVRQEAELKEYGFIKGAYKEIKVAKIEKEETLYGNNIRAGYSKLYTIWSGTKSKCYNKNDNSYKNFGALGIEMQEDWHEFSKFLSWALENGYVEGQKLNRKDITKNFCAENCYFSDKLISNSRFTRDKFLKRFYQKYNNMTQKFGHEWKSFEEFKNDMYEDYKIQISKFGEKNVMFGRLDTSKPYSKDNFIWKVWHRETNLKIEKASKSRAL